MFGIGTQEIIFIVLIVLLFFGGKKIPELMKSKRGTCHRNRHLLNVDIFYLLQQITKKASQNNGFD